MVSIPQSISSCLDSPVHWHGVSSAYHSPSRPAVVSHFKLSFAFERPVFSESAGHVSLLPADEVQPEPPPELSCSGSCCWLCFWPGTQPTPSIVTGYSEQPLPWGNHTSHTGMAQMMGLRAGRAWKHLSCECDKSLLRDNLP